MFHCSFIKSRFRSQFWKFAQLFTIEQWLVPYSHAKEMNIILHKIRDIKSYSIFGSFYFAWKGRDQKKKKKKQFKGLHSIEHEKFKPILIFFLGKHMFYLWRKTGNAFLPLYESVSKPYLKAFSIHFTFACGNASYRMIFLQEIFRIITKFTPIPFQL